MIFLQVMSIKEIPMFCFFLILKRQARRFSRAVVSNQVPLLFLPLGGNERLGMVASQGGVAASAQRSHWRLEV